MKERVPVRIGFREPGNGESLVHTGREDGSGVVGLRLVVGIAACA